MLIADGKKSVASLFIFVIGAGLEPDELWKHVNYAVNLLKKNIKMEKRQE